MKAQGRERDEPKQELAGLPIGSNVIFRPAAIKDLADTPAAQTTKPLWSNRASLDHRAGTHPFHHALSR